MFRGRGGTRHMTRPVHEHLAIWQRAMKLVRRVYRVTEHFPASEKSGMVAGMRRAAVSIPARIADASGTGSPKANLDCLDACRGTIRELQTHLVLARQLRLVPGWRTWGLRRLLDQLGMELLTEAEVIRAAMAEADVAGVIGKAA